MFLESLMTLQRDGRFPLGKLVRFYDFADVNRAIDDSDAGVTIKPVLRMREKSQPAHCRRDECPERRRAELSKAGVR